MHEADDMRSASTCKGCGEWIEWALLNNRPHPFDMKPSPDGEYELVTQSGPTTQLLAIHHRHRVPTMRLHKSHFATCPNADQFRRVKREKPDLREDG